MPRLTEQRIFSSPSLVIARVDCDGRDPCHPVDERIEGDRVILPILGRFAFRSSAGRSVLDPSSGIFAPEGLEYHISHPHGSGDVCLVLAGPLVSAAVREGRVVRHVRPEARMALSRLLPGPRRQRPEALGVEETVLEALNGCEARQSAAGPADEAIAERIEWALSLRFDEGLGIEELSAAAGVSPFHACRAFRRARGTSIGAFRRELRLRHALALVLDTGLSLADIAYEAGFANQGHFANSFRRRFGLPASSFRGRRDDGHPPAGT
jgi:AraC-like DNA-binding protein